MPTSLRVHEAQVASFILPGQPVGEVLVDIAQNARNVSRGIVAAGHTRTGNLFRSISASRTPDKYYSPLHASTFIASNREYAFWVEKGTALGGTGFISSLSRKPMPVPNRGLSQRGVKGGELRARHFASGGNFPKLYTLEDQVRGQKPVRFLERGLNKAMAEFRTWG